MGLAGTRSQSFGGDFAVVREGDGWRVIGSHHKFGRYAYRVDAEEIALRLAERARAAGQSSAALVQDESGELRPTGAVGE
jgi:hypothetical protein